MVDRRNNKRATELPADANRVTGDEAAPTRAERVRRGTGAAKASPTPASAGSHVLPRRAERRPEMIKQRRDERRQVYERQRRRTLLIRIGLAILGLLVLGGIGYAAYQRVNDDGQPAIQGVKNYKYAGGQHSTEPVEYAEVPPVGGIHDPTWQNCGFYGQAIRSENAVHAMEHGAVWITYRPDLPKDQVDLLRQKAKQPYMLVSPFPNLLAPVVASSWDHQVQLTSAIDPRLDQFLSIYKEGPGTPEKGASCSGGIGNPE